MFGIVSTFATACILARSLALLPVTSQPRQPNSPWLRSQHFADPSAAGAFDDSRTGGGVGASARVPYSKQAGSRTRRFYGDGTGRFGSAQLADATLRPDGTMALIHGAHWLGSLDFHFNPKLDIYGYVGGEYAGRTAYTGYQSVSWSPRPPPRRAHGCGGLGQQLCPGGGIQPSYPALTTTSISTSGIGGYGSPTHANNTGCSTEVPPGGSSLPRRRLLPGDTRYIAERNPRLLVQVLSGRKGKMQIGMQYSYFYRKRLVWQQWRHTGTTSTLFSSRRG